MLGLDRPTEDPLGAVTRDLERLLLGHRPGHQLAQLSDIGRAVNVLIAHWHASPTGARNRTQCGGRWQGRWYQHVLGCTLRVQERAIAWSSV